MKYINEMLSDYHSYSNEESDSAGRLQRASLTWSGIVATSSYFPTITVYTQRQIRELSLSHSARVSLLPSFTLKLNVTISAQG